MDQNGWLIGWIGVLICVYLSCRHPHSSLLAHHLEGLGEVHFGRRMKHMGHPTCFVIMFFKMKFKSHMKNIEKCSKR